MSFRIASPRLHGSLASAIVLLLGLALQASSSPAKPCWLVPPAVLRVRRVTLFSRRMLTCVDLGRSAHVPQHGLMNRTSAPPSSIRSPSCAGTGGRRPFLPTPDFHEIRASRVMALGVNGPPQSGNRVLPSRPVTSSGAGVLPVLLDPGQRPLADGDHPVLSCPLP